MPTDEASERQNEMLEITGNGEEDSLLLATNLSGTMRKLDEVMRETAVDNRFFVRGTSSTSSLRSRSLQVLQQDGEHDGNWDCLNLDVVDACRGTSVSQTYRGNFKLFDGECKGDFVDGLPIYVSSDRPNKPLYIYALGIYPETWSVAALRGLVRWRIVSFENFDDKTSCRIESANVNHIEFAADGQPYNYYPTIYCFDENGDDISGFKSSTINIRCNDKAETVGGNDASAGNTVGIVIGIIVALVVLGVVGYYSWKRCKDRGHSICPAASKGKNYDDDDSRYYRQSRASETRFARDSILTGGSRFSRDTGTKDSRYSRDTGSRVSRDIDEFVDETPLTAKDVDVLTNGSSVKTPDTVYVPTVEEPSEPSYVDEAVEDPINDLRKVEQENMGDIHGRREIRDKVTRAPHGSDTSSEMQSSNWSPPPSPRRMAPESEPQQPPAPSKRSNHKTPIPEPSGHNFNGNNRSQPQKNPSNPAISKDITDIVEKIDQELDEALSSGDEGRSRRGRADDDAASSDNERSAYYSGNPTRPVSPTRNEHRDRSHSREAAPKRRSSGFGSSGHDWSGYRNREGSSHLKNKDPYMDLTRRSKFREIRNNFSDKSRALGRNMPGNDKRSSSEERSRQEVFANTGHGDSKRSLTSSSHRDGRSRSMERWMNANQNNERSRSHSRERSGEYVEPKGRSASKERSAHGDKTNGRSMSRERSSAAEHFANRHRPSSMERNESNRYENSNRDRSRSTERSGANDFANRRRSSRDRSHHGSRHNQKSNSQSSDRMATSDHIGKRKSDNSPRERERGGSSSDHAGKPSSSGWETSGEQAEKRRGRSGSPERSRHDYRGRSPSPYKDRNESESRERSRAEEFASRKSRSSHDRPNHRPSAIKRPRNPSYSNPLYPGVNSPTRGRGSLDASQLNKNVTKNPDGSVTVAVKRTREDGAIVTTKTKYATVALAKRHGIDVQ
jgi:hypothetical protein